MQVEAVRAVSRSLRRAAGAVARRLTIADGIAVKRPGELTLRADRALVDDLVMVGEDEVAEAMVFLWSGPSSSSRAPARWASPPSWAGRCAPATKAPPCAILSGGNVDIGLLAEVARRHETQSGRRLVLLARLPDRPGSLAGCWRCVGAEGANLLDVQHIREGIDLHIRETAVQLVLETREHAARSPRRSGTPATASRAAPLTATITALTPPRCGRRSDHKCIPPWRQRVCVVVVVRRLSAGPAAATELPPPAPHHGASPIGLGVPLHTQDERVLRSLERLGDRPGPSGR